jgi:antibiotic biosynthesis monooxygenase (ABM) superfamily enzyme
MQGFGYIVRVKWHPEYTSVCLDFETKDKEVALLERAFPGYVTTKLVRTQRYDPNYTGASYFRDLMATRELAQELQDKEVD